jgi:uncharacterized membrane protein YkvA (DUF1232 family)
MSDFSTLPDLDAPRYGLPAVVAREERIVRIGFWRKLRGVAGRVPFSEDLVAAFYCAIDKRTPLKVRGTLLAALVYFITPIDLIPDFLTGIGFTDDAAVLATAIGIVGGHIKERHRKAARAALLQPEPEAVED